MRGEWMLLSVVTLFTAAMIGGCEKDGRAAEAPQAEQKPAGSPKHAGKDRAIAKAPAPQEKHVRFLDPEHAPNGKGGWISLFNGKDCTGWHLREPKKETSWHVEDGILRNVPSPDGIDLISDPKFWNFEAYYEYRAPKGSNSGFYLRGRYEIQIYDSFGKPAEAHSNGSIYGQKAPSKNVTRESNQWQSVYARMVDKKITVIMNGEKIIDEFEVSHATGAELDHDYDQPGSIFLQGDHGQVEFRYVYVRPLPRQ